MKKNNSILNFDLRYSKPRKDKYQEIGNYLLKYSKLDKDFIFENLKSIFMIEDCNMRFSAFFALFLLRPNSEFKEILDFNYNNSIPYDETINKIFININNLFNKYDLVFDREALRYSVNKLYSFDYNPKLKNEYNITRKDFLKVFYFFNAKKDLKEAIKIDDLIKKYDIPL